MSLNLGIVGLPNVGKSTLFNALTRNDVLAANYPFATIEPNEGVVALPDPRLDKLAEMFEREKKLLAKVIAKARKVIGPLFTREALLAKSEAARRRRTEHDAKQLALMAMGIPKMLLRKLWADPPFIIAFVTRYYPEMLLS